MRTQVTQLDCDLCGYGGAFSDEADFVRVLGGFDLCRWCASPVRSAWSETGGHRVTFHGEAWTCTCGMTHEATLIRIRLTWPISAHILAAVPRLPNATAHAHLERGA